MSCITNDILKQVIGFHTAHKTWSMLEKNFASKYRARMIQLKEKLQNFKKRNLYVNKYVLQIKVLCDELILA